MPKNNWRHKKSLAKYIYYYKGPGEYFQKNGIIDNFNIQYAFKRIIGSDHKEYIFFGDKPTWDHDSPGESLKGWLQQDSYMLWDNQVAVYYNKESLKHHQRQAVPVFNQKKHLVEHLKNGSMSHIIGHEKNNSLKIAPYTIRFPVIDHQGNLVNILWMNDQNLCFKAWVSTKDRNNINQLDFFCLFMRFRLDTLVGLMGIIIDGTRTSSYALEKVIYSACEQATGDPILENETLAEYIQRVFNIPYHEISGPLRKTPKEIENEFLINKTFCETFIKNLKRSYKLIRLVQEKKIAEIQWDQSKKEWLNVSSSIEKEWFFNSSLGLEYCWLPFEFFP